MGRKLAAIYPVGNRDERSFIPKRIWVVWPQFFLEGTWLDFDELSRFVLEEGFFDTRDEALKRLGSLQRTLRGRWFEAFFGYRKSS